LSKEEKSKDNFSEVSNSIESSTGIEQKKNLITPTKTKQGYDSKGTQKNEEDSFLVKGDRGTAKGAPRSRTAKNSEVDKNVPRQSNSDIQDIISGIVKLLNGNVNVHANNQGSRLPPNNRINNRGPPRIAEAQLPADAHDSTKIVPPTSQAFPFDPRPSRPFLTGVPLPEQIVPSMQQNYRPGFISQNRPPWKRPKPPRPSLSRRPVPTFNHPIPLENVENYEIENIKPEENYDKVEKLPNLEFETKTSNDTTQTEEEEAEESLVTPTITTIIQSISEVNAVTSDLSLEMKNETDTVNEIHTIESSLNENFSNQQQLSTMRTPTLTSTIAINTTSILSSSSSASNVNIQSSSAFHPRPGLVLDDTDFKPGKNFNSQQTGGYSQSNQNLPDGYGEIFDVTLTAIQGPTGNTGSQQTINVNPYGNYQQSDEVIFKPSGDQNFVSIDGKRTYFNLFSDDSRKPSAAASIEPTRLVKPEIKGSGYVIAEPIDLGANRKTNNNNNNLPKNSHLHQKHKPHMHNVPQVRIDTCILGDDSTCDQSQNEKCKIENGISSCNCKPGKN
jgi:hypothetical protein